MDCGGVVDWSGVPHTVEAMTAPFLVDAPPQRSVPPTGWDLPRPPATGAPRRAAPEPETESAAVPYVGKYARKPAPTRTIQTGRHTPQARHAAETKPSITAQEQAQSRDDALGWVAFAFAVIAFGFELVALAAIVLQPDSYVLAAGCAVAAVVSLTTAAWTVDS